MLRETRECVEEIVRQLHPLLHSKSILLHLLLLLNQILRTSIGQAESRVYPLLRHFKRGRGDAHLRVSALDLHGFDHQGVHVIICHAEHVLNLIG